VNVAFLALGLVVVGAALYLRAGLPQLPGSESGGGPHYEPNEFDPWIFDPGVSAGEIDFSQDQPAAADQAAVPVADASDWWDDWFTWSVADDGPRFEAVAELGFLDDISLGAAEGFGMSEPAAQAWPFAEFIYAAAARHGVRSELIAALIRTESSFNPNAQAATSSARGLMQLTRAAAADVGADYESLFDPALNVEAGTAYLRRQIDAFGGDERAAVRAYFQGAGNERRGTGSPYYADALRYEQKVFAYA
jgi:soluble lytic murein transglycosylase-like protein